MQSHHHTGLEPSNLALLHEEWERLISPVQTKKPKTDIRKKASETSGCPPELSPVVTVLPGLIRLVNECTDRPVTKFRPTIKHLIQEQLFMEAAGDSIVDPHQNVQVDSYVELTIRVLVRVRENALGQDEWSDAPVTPQMFG
jgi:hypothetical protein